MDSHAKHYSATYEAGFLDREPLDVLQKRPEQCTVVLSRELDLWLDRPRQASPSCPIKSLATPTRGCSADNREVVSRLNAAVSRPVRHLVTVAALGSTCKLISRFRSIRPLSSSVSR